MHCMIRHPRNFMSALDFYNAAEMTDVYRPMFDMLQHDSGAPLWRNINKPAGEADE